MTSSVTILSFSLLFLKACATEMVHSEYMTLVEQVFDEKKMSSVFILHGFEYREIWQQEVMFDISKMFSKRRIPSMTAALGDIDEIRSYYFTNERPMTRIREPLFITFIKKENYLQKLHQVSKNFFLEEQLFFFLIFLPSNKKAVNDFCMTPVGNPFQLRIDMMMVVKCSENNTLRAWYTLDGNEMKVSTWALWHPKSKYLEMVHEEKKEKVNLRGKRLTIGIVTGSRLLQWDEETGKLDGYFGAVFNDLSKSMNFTWTIERKDTNYGIWNETGKFWTGAIKTLQSREVDMIISDLTMDPLRLRVIDFTKILLYSRRILYVKKPKYGYTVNWSGYFKFVENRVWIAIILLVLITSLLVTLMNMKTSKFIFLPEIILENCLNVWGIYCQQSLLKFPTALPLRIAYFSVFVSSLIILIYYDAFVISYLTYPIKEEFLPNLTAFVADGSYKLIVIRKSSDYNFLEYATKHPFNNMFRLMLKDSELPTTDQAAFDMVCDKKLGFYSNDIIRKTQTLDIKCDLHLISTSLVEYIAMGLQKDSEYKSEINRNFVEFNANGVLKRLMNQQFKQYSQPKTQSFDKVTISEIAVLLTIVASGITFGIIIFLLEKMTYRQRKAEVPKIKQNFITPENSRKWYNFENQKRNPERYNKDGELNIKFLRKDYKHKIIFSSADSRIIFKR